MTGYGGALPRFGELNRIIFTSKLDIQKVTASALKTEYATLV
jgi:hypothetical protein